VGQEQEVVVGHSSPRSFSGPAVGLSRLSLFLRPVLEDRDFPAHHSLIPQMGPPDSADTAEY
jgi:hypothetical protein